MCSVRLWELKTDGQKRETLGVGWGQQEEGIYGQGNGECVYNQEKGTS